ncbi:MAG: hypothetical protein QM612_01370 [Thermomonas sp.]|uniref:glycosyltransferase family 2 protein n=1 Tax=Thermomonas sp. TaxID=1971895 RepID=UPI0039E6B65B
MSDESSVVFELLGKAYLVDGGYEPPQGAIEQASALGMTPDAWLWDEVYIDFYPRHRRLRTLRVATPIRDARLQSQLHGPGRGAISAERLEALRQTGCVGADASLGEGLAWLLQHGPETVARFPGHYRFAGPSFERRHESSDGIAPDTRARTIAVILNYHNHADVTITCLEHLAAQVLDAELELVVIDNRSDPGEHKRVDAALSRLFPSDRRSALSRWFRGGGRSVRVQHVLYDAPYNLSYQNNFGVALTSAEAVVLLNNDCFMLDPGCLQTIANWSLVPGIGTVSPRIVGRGGRLVSAGVHAGIDYVTGAQRIWECEFTPLSGLVRWTAANCTACAAISRDAWYAVGGMDTWAFPCQYEDADLCLRMSEHGYRHLYVGTMSVFHEPGTSEPRRQEEFARLMQRLFERHAPNGLAGDWPDFEVLHGVELPAQADAGNWTGAIEFFRRAAGWQKKYQGEEIDDAGKRFIADWQTLVSMCEEARSVPTSAVDADAMNEVEQLRMMLQGVQVSRSFAAFSRKSSVVASSLMTVESYLQDKYNKTMEGAERP